jgi:eukaryotic-like serine/threonine-protein kinase
MAHSAGSGWLAEGQIFDVALDESPPYFVLELIIGESLDEHLRRGGTMPWVRATRICVQVLAGLAALHRAGVIHRDLKPSNVLLWRQGSSEHAKVIDLGVAQLMTGKAFQHGGPGGRNSCR